MSTRSLGSTIGTRRRRSTSCDPHLNSTQILDGLVTLIRHWCASNPKLKEDIRQQPHLYTHVFGRDEEKPKKKWKGA